MAPPDSDQTPPIPDQIPNATFDGDITYDTLTKEDVVGTGGNATVYRVRHPDHDRALAVKEPHIHHDVPSDLAARFRTEAETWANLDDQEYIVTVLDWATTPHPWIALEYMDAGSLQNKIGDCSLTEALWIGICLTRAIHHAHRHGVAHLDLKPTNILFRQGPTDSWDIPKVTDWGLAKLLLTHSSSLEGLSPQYAAPEQFNPDRYGRPDDYTDIYQLGTVLYEVLTGTHPFMGSPNQIMQAVLTTDPDPPTARNPNLPSELNSIFNYALAKEKDNRYESVLDFRRDLETLLGTLTEYTPPSDGPTLPDVQNDDKRYERNRDVGSPSTPVIDLTSQGFIELTPSYFEQHTPMPPAQAWRAGLGLPEVQAGYAIDREIVQDNERVNISTYLIEQLSTGSDTAILGPPGAGKSTVCKTVACRWYEEDHGPVVYRKSGTSDQFDQPAVLTQYLRQADGHPLVVVEDAVHPDATAIFEVMETLGEKSDVAFLLDAREQEWQDPTAVDIDARQNTYRQRVIDPVHVPQPDARECKRLIQHFEQLLDRPIELPVEELVAAITTDATARTEAADSTSALNHRVGELLLLLHRITGYAEPLEAGDATTPTTLIDDVQETYEMLQAAETDLVLEVGILVNLLNAAGLDVHPELVYALAPDADGARIDTALAALDGRVVFLPDDAGPASDRTDVTAYETVHGAWSAEFLSYLCDAEGDRAAHRYVGRCLTAVLALADESDRRDEVNWRLQGQTPYLGRITTNPQIWTRNIVTQLFRLGLDYSHLAPLFGTTEYSRIELPATSPAELRLQCAEWRGRMYIDGGRLDRAEREFNYLTELAANTDLGEEEVTVVQARSYRYLGKIAQKRGNLATAEEQLEQGLTLARQADDAQLEADCLNERAGIEWMRGTFDDETERQMEQALDLYREIGAVKSEIKLLQNLGLTLVQRGRFNTAAEHLERSLLLAREIDATQAKVSGLQNKGHLAYRQGNIDIAEQYWTHALDLARESGHKQAEAVLLNNLGEVARERTEYTTAEEYYTRSLDLARTIDAQKSIARAQTNLAMLAHEQNDVATAKDHATESLDLRREINDRRGEAVTLRLLGRLAVHTGDFATAEERLTRSRDLATDVEDPYLEAETLVAIGECAKEQGEFTDARDVLVDAADLAVDIGAARLTLEIVRSLVDVCQELDDQATIRDWCTTGFEVANQTEVQKEEWQSVIESVPVDIEQ